MKRAVGLVILLFLCLPIQCTATELSAAEVSSLQTYVPIRQYQSTNLLYGVVGDLDNDNLTQEVLWANGSHVIAFNSSGARLWRTPVSATFPVIGDFDRDGYTDDFYNNPTLGPGSGMAYNRTGFSILDSINGTVHYANWSCSNFIYAVGDLNKDGYADDIISERPNGSFQPMICAFSYADPYHTYWNFSLGYTFPQTKVAGGLLIGDLDADGAPDDVVVTTKTNWTYALNETGGLIWGVPVGSGFGSPKPMRSNIVLADLDRDGVLNEVVIYSTDGQKIIAINGSGTILWNFSIDYFGAYMAVGDFDHSGYMDNLAVTAGVGGDLRRVCVLNNAGIELWNHTFTNDVSYLITGDLNNSGFQDGVVVISHPHNFVLNRVGDVVGLGGDSGLPYLGDFDGDGNAVDLMTAYYDITLYRFGSPNASCTLLAAQPSNGDWELTGPYVEGLHAIQFNLTNHEGFPLNLTCTFATPHAAVTWDFMGPGDDVPVGNTTSWVVLQLDPGTYNLTVTLLHEGVPFHEFRILVTVEAAPGIGSALVLCWLVAVVIIVGFYRRRLKERW